MNVCGWVLGILDLREFRGVGLALGVLEEGFGAPERGFRYFRIHGLPLIWGWAEGFPNLRCFDMCRFRILYRTGMLT